MCVCGAFIQRAVAAAAAAELTELTNAEKTEVK